MRVLILGGTTEASELTRLLAADPRFETTVSLAGRTRSRGRNRFERGSAASAALTAWSHG